MKTRLLLILTIILIIVPATLPLSAVAQEKEEKPYQIEKVYPNPFSQYVNIEIKSENNIKAQFELFDILGNTVQKWNDISIVEGNQSIRLDIKQLHAGIYLLRSRFGDEVIVTRLRKT